MSQLSFIQPTESQLAKQVQYLSQRHEELLSQNAALRQDLVAAQIENGDLLQLLAWIEQQVQSRLGEGPWHEAQCDMHGHGLSIFQALEPHVKLKRPERLFR